MVFTLLLNFLRIYEVLFCILDNLISVRLPMGLLHFNSFLSFVAGTFFKSITKPKRKPVNTEKKDINLSANTH